MTDLPRGAKINNPGNIRISEIPWVGKVEPSSDPDFEQFQEMTYGVRAAAKIFLDYHRFDGLSTIKDFIGRWAPPSDNNPTGAYAAYVASGCGVDPSDIFNLEDAGNLSSLLTAVFRDEDGGSFVSPQDLATGISWALGLAPMASA